MKDPGCLDPLDSRPQINRKGTQEILFSVFTLWNILRTFYPGHPPPQHTQRRGHRRVRPGFWLVLSLFASSTPSSSLQCFGLFRGWDGIGNFLVPTLFRFSKGATLKWRPHDLRNFRPPCLHLVLIICSIEFAWPPLLHLIFGSQCWRRFSMVSKASSRLADCVKTRQPQCEFQVRKWVGVIPLIKSWAPSATVTQPRSNHYAIFHYLN